MMTFDPFLNIETLKGAQQETQRSNYVRIMSGSLEIEQTLSVH